MKDDETENREKLTSDIDDGHSDGQSPAELVSTTEDPRIIEFVRFLARAAAEKDYAKLIEESRRKPGRGKESIQ